MSGLLIPASGLDERFVVLDDVEGLVAAEPSGQSSKMGRPYATSSLAIDGQQGSAAGPRNPAPHRIYVGKVEGHDVHVVNLRRPYGVYGPLGPLLILAEQNRKQRTPVVHSVIDIQYDRPLTLL